MTLGSSGLVAHFGLAYARFAPGESVTAALALLLLVSTECGAQIFPPLWGILAIPQPAGALAVVLLHRR